MKKISILPAAGPQIAGSCEVYRFKYFSSPICNLKMREAQFDCRIFSFSITL